MNYGDIHDAAAVFRGAPIDGFRSQALKHFTLVESFFVGYREDMYDFHNYALRNVTIASYLEVP